MISVVFNSREEYEAFRAEFPSALADPGTLLGEPAFEFPGDDVTPPSGLCIIAHHFTTDEAALLQMAGADVRVGGIDGPAFGEDDV